MLPYFRINLLAFNNDFFIFSNILLQKRTNVNNFIRFFISVLIDFANCFIFDYACFFNLGLNF